MSKILKLLDRWHLIFLVIMAFFLNIFNLWTLNYGNGYYAAAIKSMLSGFRNFFFVSFDSTGFISVDKAPLSLWLDTLFAKVFGFNGVVILLPHALAGLAVTVITYLIMKKAAGKIPAIISSLAITLSPVNVAVYRNNTPDSLLLVFILLSILSIVNYFDTRKTKDLLLSALMLGLGFNTKMLQAFLLLPALMSVIFLFSSGNFIKRIKPVLLFMIVTLVVSFSWITIVDLTPAALRPYIGGSTNNSAWNLAFNYNGSQRLLGENGIGSNPGFNVGTKGFNRLFTGEMGTQTGWLLGSVLLFSVFFLIKNFKGLKGKLLGQKIEFSLPQKLIVLSIIFFITQFLFFSYASFFHSYYLNIFAVPISLILGGLFYEIMQKGTASRILYIFLFISLPIQTYLIYQANYAYWLIPVILLIGLVSFYLILNSQNRVQQKFVYILTGSLFLAPLIWSGYTTIQGNTATAIFIGGPNIGNSFGRLRFPGPPNQTLAAPPGAVRVFNRNGINSANSGRGVFDSENVSTNELNFLKDNYSGEKYFVAVMSAGEAEGFILNDNIGNVLTLGGFSGRDQAITLDQFKSEIKSGEIRFILLNYREGGSGGSGRNDGFRGAFDGRRDGNAGLRQNTGINFNNQGDGHGGGMFNANSVITNWVTNNCKIVPGINGLYDCRAAVSQL